MLNVVLIDNPFDPFLKDAVRHQVEAHTARQCLQNLFPGFVEFEHPTLCLVDGEPLMRAEWDKALPHGATVSFIRLAQGVVEIIIAIVVLVVAVVVALVFVKASNPAAIGADPQTTRNGDPVYTLSGEHNQNKLNNAIECAYGVNKLYPAYASIPYSLYENNEQYQYSLFCLGHGQFNVNASSARFEDTPLSQYTDVDMIVYPPGTATPLVNNAVFTAATVSNIELFGKNEDGYKKVQTAYDTNEPGTFINKIQCDVSLPAGLYKLDVAGNVGTLEITATFEYRSVNNASVPTSAWMPLFKFKKKLKTLTPQRYTLQLDVARGRYQVRARRTNAKDTDVRAGNIIKWESLRSFLSADTDFGDVTLIAVKARATNQLNNNAANRFNILAQRKLPTWSPGGGWTAPTETRNPVWAFCDVFMATYGGRLAASFLDLNDLYTLSLYYAANNIYFDYIFDQRSTVWEVARSIARVGRGVPMLTGSQLTIIRDQAKTVAVAVFNQNNILAGSFQWSIKLPTVAETDGIEVEYMDETTWIAETVVCLLGTDTGNATSKLKLPGCTDRTRAFQEGLYQRAVELYQKESIEFKTGLEGHLPLFGDLILVTHDVPRWGSGGVVLDITGTIVTLDNPVTFGVGVHKLILRKKDGSAYGPVTCTAGADAYHVIVSPAITEPFNFDDIHEKPYYLFGLENLECKRCVVVGVTPEGDDVVSIRCAAYDERIYSFSGVPTPDRYAPPHVVVNPDLPVVAGLTVTQVDGSPDFVTVYWPPALGATHYVVETSANGVDYALVDTVNVSSVVLRVTGGFLYIRVAGVNVGRGPWALWSGDINLNGLPANVSGLSVIRRGPGSITFGWTAVPYAGLYAVVIQSKATSATVHAEDASGTEFTYTLAMGAADGLMTRNIVFKVRAKNAQGVSAIAASIEAVIPNVPVEPPIIPHPLLMSNTHVTMDLTIVKMDHT